MKIICVIPARAESTRFFEKPLALICGKPMIRWVWEHCKEVDIFEEVYVATDSDKIRTVAEEFGAKVVMTRSDHDTATERLYEVSTHIYSTTGNFYWQHHSTIYSVTKIGTPLMKVKHSLGLSSESSESMQPGKRSWSG